MRRPSRGLATWAIVTWVVALSACSGTPRTRVRTITQGRSSEGLREDQADAETGSMSELVWRSDTDTPSIWSYRGSRDYFVPRVGLRFVTPASYVFDASLEPSQHTVLQGPTVPRAVRGERLFGDRVLQIRGDGPAPVVVSLVEIPLDVEPSTFCAWAARSDTGRASEIARDEAERLASSSTRLCELVTPSRTTRVRGFLRAGWLLVFSQQISAGATAELDALVASVRAFDDE